MTSEITIRYAESDDDVVTIHRFLLVVASPNLPGPVDHMMSATEVWRVVKGGEPDCVGALMAFQGEKLVGTLGLLRVSHWWGKDVFFLANRWFFTLPHSRAGGPLLKEARELAEAMGVECIIYSEQKGKVIVLNRHPNRDIPNPLIAAFVAAQNPN
jgi:hypothetical protein